MLEIYNVLIIINSSQIFLHPVNIENIYWRWEINFINFSVYGLAFKFIKMKEYVQAYRTANAAHDTYCRVPEQ